MKIPKTELVKNYGKKVKPHEQRKRKVLNGDGIIRIITRRGK